MIPSAGPGSMQARRLCDRLTYARPSDRYNARICRRPSDATGEVAVCVIGSPPGRFAAELAEDRIRGSRSARADLFWWGSLTTVAAGCFPGLAVAGPWPAGLAGWAGILAARARPGVL